MQCPKNTERYALSSGTSLSDCACRQGSCDGVACLAAFPWPECNPLRLNPATGVLTVTECVGARVEVDVRDGSERASARGPPRAIIS